MIASEEQVRYLYGCMLDQGVSILVSVMIPLLSYSARRMQAVLQNAGGSAMTRICPATPIVAFIEMLSHFIHVISSS